MSNSVTIFGTGEIGSALASVLANIGVEVRTFDRESEVDSISEIIFLCVPTIAIKDVAKKVAPLLNKNNIIVSVSKGLDVNGEATYEILPQLFNDVSWAIMGGPMIAEELIKGLGGSAIIASSDREVFEKLSVFFRNTNFDVKYSDDIVGVSLCGVLKNIYSIALGNLEGKKMGNNAKGGLVTQIISEMSDIVTHFGGQKESVYTLAGIGDLIATGFSLNSSNFQVGVDLATKGRVDHKSEGLLALPLFIKKFDNLDKYPILKSTAELVFNFSPVV